MFVEGMTHTHMETRDTSLSPQPIETFKYRATTSVVGLRPSRFIKPLSRSRSRRFESVNLGPHSLLILYVSVRLDCIDRSELPEAPPDPLLARRYFGFSTLLAQPIERPINAVAKMDIEFNDELNEL